jgi:hypothetical protein
VNWCSSWFNEETVGQKKSDSDERFATRAFPNRLPNLFVPNCLPSLLNVLAHLCHERT